MKSKGHSSRDHFKTCMYICGYYKWNEFNTYLVVVTHKLEYTVVKMNVDSSQAKRVTA